MVADMEAPCENTQDVINQAMVRMVLQQLVPLFHPNRSDNSCEERILWSLSVAFLLQGQQVLGAAYSTDLVHVACLEREKALPG